MILMIDNYDSFTFNSYSTEQMGKMSGLRNDKITVDRIRNRSQYFFTQPRDG